MNKGLMLDCETLGVGERPVILSIGAVVFDDRDIHGYFTAGIDMNSCMKEDFSVDEDTVLWWGEQNEIARKAAFSGKDDIKQTLLNLVAFYKENQCTEIWSKGALADIRWINNALDHFGIEHPWKFYQEFCFRTLLKTKPKFKLPFTGMPHHALDDALHQVKEFQHVKKLEADQIQTLIAQGQNINELHDKIRDLEYQMQKAGAAS